MKHGLIHVLIMSLLLSGAAVVPSHAAEQQSSRDMGQQDSRDSGRRSSRDSGRRSYRDSSSQSPQSPQSSQESARPSASPAGPATERQTANVPNFSTFKLLMDRNIFDPRRRPGYMTTTTVAAPPPVERIGLQGVLLEKGEGLAFFEGSNPEYNATLHLGGIIAGHQLVEIRTDGVVMAYNNKSFDFPFNCQLIRKIKSDWEMTTASEQVYSTPYSSSSSRDDRSFSRDDRGSRGDRFGSRGDSGSRYGSRSDSGGSRYGSRSDSSGSRYGSRGDRSSGFGGDRSSGGGDMSGGPGSQPQMGGAPTPAPTPLPAGAQEDLMRRLMERRKKETGQ